MGKLEKSTRENEFLALWLAPLASVVPLIPVFALRSSPMFLGKLMDDSSHPMLWPNLGPLLSAMAVIFDGAFLGYLAVGLLVAPVWLVLRHSKNISAWRICLLFGIAGFVASQLAGGIAQGVRQAGLRELGATWQPTLLGCLCGLTAAAFCVWFTKRRVSDPIKSFLFVTPVLVLCVCAATLSWSAQGWRGR